MYYISESYVVVYIIPTMFCLNMCGEEGELRKNVPKIVEYGKENI